MIQLAVDHISSLERANNNTISREGLNMRARENNDMQEIYVTFYFFYLEKSDIILGLLNRINNATIIKNWIILSEET